MTPAIRIPWWRTELGDAEVSATTQAIRERHVHHGPVCRQFEAALAARFEFPHVVTTTSGSVALLLAMMACGVGPGDEVVVPALTFIAPAHAARLLGARVRLVDVCADRPLLDVAQLERVVNEGTKAIVAVHLDGRAADVAGVSRLASRVGARVIEDCAQALASRGPRGWLGSEGDVAAYSTGITKLITTGEGGFATTGDAGLYDRLLRGRNHGTLAIADNVFTSPGTNFRMTDLQAAVGLAQLAQVDGKTAALRRVYESYLGQLQTVSWLDVLRVDDSAGELPLWVEVLTPRRDEVMAGLRARGIEAKAFHPSLAESPHLESEGAYPNAKRFADAGLTLPSGPDRTEAEVAETVEALAAIGAELGLS